jgi:hypothetical protein
LTGSERTWSDGENTNFQGDLGEIGASSETSTILRPLSKEVLRTKDEGRGPDAENLSSSDPLFLWRLNSKVDDSFSISAEA